MFFNSERTLLLDSKSLIIELFIKAILTALYSGSLADSTQQGCLSPHPGGPGDYEQLMNTSPPYATPWPWQYHIPGVGPRNFKSK